MFRNVHSHIYNREYSIENTVVCRIFTESGHKMSESMTTEKTHLAVYLSKTMTLKRCY